MIVILTGVCGCGKTTVGEALARKLEWQFIDGDDFHAEVNKDKMAKGTELTDEDRKPWLKRIHQHIRGWATDGIDGVVACSALKQRYRRILITGTDETEYSESVQGIRDAIPSSDFLLVLLTGSHDLLAERLKHRQGHFMDPGLLNSQLAILEDPDEQMLVVDIKYGVNETVDIIKSRLKRM
jgi:gluconokinase